MQISVKDYLEFALDVIFVIAQRVAKQVRDEMKEVFKNYIDISDEVFVLDAHDPLSPEMQNFRRLLSKIKEEITKVTDVFNNIKYQPDCDSGSVSEQYSILKKVHLCASMCAWVRTNVFAVVI